MLPVKSMQPLLTPLAMIAWLLQEVFVSSCSISPCVFSDHDYVNLTHDLAAFAPSGPGLNNSLLDEVSFCENISARITDLSSCLAHF